MIRAFQKAQGIGAAAKHLAGESPDSRRLAWEQADLVDNRGKFHLEVGIEVRRRLGGRHGVFRACQRPSAEHKSPERDRVRLFQKTPASGVRAPGVALQVHRSSG